MMNQFFDLMLDTETMGLPPTGALMQIGARFFDIKTRTLGPSFLRNIHLATAMRDGGTVDAGTIIFWLGQSDEARQVRFGGEEIRVVLADFGKWITEHCRTEDVRPWGNSARFDCGIVESACQRSNIELPWYWSQERCFRTTRNQHPQVEYDPNEKGDAAHNALVDADFQINHLFKIADYLKTRNRELT